MRKLLLLCISLNISCVFAYPAYMASDCDNPLEQKAVTYEQLGDIQKKYFYTQLKVAFTIDFLGVPGGKWLINEYYDSHGHANDVSFDASEIIFDKTWYAIATNRTLKAPGEYLKGVDSVHYWRKRDYLNPSSFYNSTRHLYNVTTCNADADWTEEP